MNDPLAYFISFTCKGARFHGDPRGTVDRNHNAYGTDFLHPDQVRVDSESHRMAEAPFVMNLQQRTEVESTIIAVGLHRGWTIHGMAVRTNHVHIVVSAPRQTPESVMLDVKSYSTRRLREKGFLADELKPWTRHGSTKYLWNEKSVELAVNYVVEHQDDLDRYLRGAP